MPEESAKEVLDKPRSMGGDVKWTDTPRTRPAFEGDVEALEADLRWRVRGEVRFDSATRAAYSTDASNYRMPPIGVVIPSDKQDLIAAVHVCREHSAPITHRGGGTSLAGQTANAAVIIDSSKYVNRLVEVNPEERYAVVEPGVIRDHLTQQTEREHHLSFAPDTSTHQWATFGGMIGNNACGLHSQMARRTQDNVEELEVLLYDGTRLRVGPTSEEEIERIIRAGGRRGDIYRRLRDLRDRHAEEIRERYPEIPRRVSGFNLEELLPEKGFNVARALVGTEGTCVTVLEAKVKLVESPPYRTLTVLGFEDVYRAADHVQEIGEMGCTALEGMDRKLIEYMRQKDLHTDYLPLLPDGQAYLIVEWAGASKEEVNRVTDEKMAEIGAKEWDGLVDAAVVVEADDKHKIMAIRESGLGATAHLPNTGETWPGWEDTAVPPPKLGDYLRDLRALYDAYGYDASVYGHFGQGVVHTRIPFDLQTETGLEQYRAFVDEASDLCMQYEGSFSSEHGDGQARGELLPKMYGQELVDAFREFKEIWDPDYKMNPGKVVDPRRVTENLRLGTDYHPGEFDTDFGYPEDGGSFSQAALRCVGVGRCRRQELAPGDVMCPSYIATHEEMHTTRGRARLLFEMLNGDETPDAWNNDDVFEALDLCLACKGCKNDCPVNVDMATYKAEFLSHYYSYAENPRPRHAFALGLIHWWARIASQVPRLANFFTQTDGIKEVIKKIGGVTPERDMPRFAPQTFRDWFANRPTVSRRDDHWVSQIQNPESKIRSGEVVLFPDTFHDHFEVGTARAAVEVLEDAGCQVIVPREKLCCGRPLYDYGWNDLAKRLWVENMKALRPYYRRDVPIVVLEPSCTAAFRDELVNLFPSDHDARRLSKNTHTLGEFLTDVLEDYEPPRLERAALLHGHCHHHSIMGIEADQQLLEQMGVEAEHLNSGCCGVAGSFGYEEGHYEVSMKAGEHVLLPRVREADRDALIITDGFSCRSQIEHGTDRQGLHLAEVLHLARHGNGASQPYPERPYMDNAAFSAGRQEEESSGGAEADGVGKTALAAAAVFVGSAVLGYLVSR